MELAERAERLWAAIIDRLCFLVPIVIPVILAPGILSGGSSNDWVLVTGVFALLSAVLIGIQVWLLTAHGQTIGKKALKLRIVKIADMTNGGFVTNVLMRGVIGWVISAVPTAGQIYGLADALFIFREDRRCIHDHIAGTCVIKAAPPAPAQ